MAHSAACFLAPAVATVLAILVTNILMIKGRQRQQSVVAHNSYPRGKLRDLINEDNGTVSKLSDFPEGWWTADEVFDGEKRAIFAVMPVAVAHASMFTTPGSYRVFEHPAGFPLFLVLDKDHVLRCFHNVCRHRAYPVVSTKPVGCTPILACRYHGWTYDLKGNLVKAPKFGDLKGFRKDENSLFKVHTKVDTNGVISVDLNTEPSPDAIVDVKKLSQGCVETWESEGPFNWKVTECADSFNLPSFSRKRMESHSVLSHFITLPDVGAALLVTVCPTSARTCTLRCTLYRPSATSIPPPVLSSVKADIIKCVASLEKTYISVRQGASVNATAHDLFFLKKFESHRQAEQIEGRKAWPAISTSNKHSDRFNAAEKLCQTLDASATCYGAPGATELSW